MTKLYRNYSKEWLLDSKLYCDHVSAMTRENLHSKSYIAAELAWRDEQLTMANKRVAELERDREALNKFALEKKIEALQECVGVCGFLSCTDSLKSRIKQLRKESEK